LGITILIIYNELRRRLAGTLQLGPHAATLAMNTDATVILDVREDSEYKQGHIANAVHIPLGQLAKRLTELDKYRERPLIAYCRTGNRSNSAAQLLHKQASPSTTWPAVSSPGKTQIARHQK
jgi:rhodanese-related sulfurtransferase